MSARVWVVAGAVAGALSVAAGAFGAHALKARLAPELLAVFETAVRYQMVHALALLATGWVSVAFPGRASALAGWAFLAGTVLFSGSLYLLALGGVRAVGVVTPVGGLLLIAGWLFLAWAGGVTRASDGRSARQGPRD